MSESFDTFAHGVMSGRDRSAKALALRALTRIAEPFYAGAMRVRNALYDHGLFKTHRLPRPVISVGNITTGGTGKTPIVCWLANELIKAGHHPAVLLRGYKGTLSGLSDEANLIAQIVGPDAPVGANADRVEIANKVLAHRPGVEVFLLDDAFQHRRVDRDFNLVLLDATSPFGFGHVLPRGMLREPLAGLRRADAVLITRVDQVSKEELIQISDTLLRVIPDTPVLQASFELDATSIRGKKVFAFCGIGNPSVFFRQLAQSGAEVVDRRTFADHHPYSAADIAALQNAAGSAGADLLVTTQKDLVRFFSLDKKQYAIPIVAVGQTVRMSEQDSQRLLAWAKSVIVRSAPAGPSAARGSDSEAR
ncbi:MAG TPA: tetraacyldisaccharide 4'-kinase [Tepidisphaeraceae bacterium]|nr:tetraacyldisaccharide 4'-kinase [Tepidisphaeraceae bacterium]